MALRLAKGRPRKLSGDDYRNAARWRHMWRQLLSTLIIYSLICNVKRLLKEILRELSREEPRMEPDGRGWTRIIEQTVVWRRQWNSGVAGVGGLIWHESRGSASMVGFVITQKYSKNLIKAA